MATYRNIATLILLVLAVVQAAQADSSSELVLTPQEQAQARNHGTSNLAAYYAYLRGWDHLLRNTTEDASKAIVLFKQALKLDPNYHRAYAALAQAYWDVAGQQRDDDGIAEADITAWEYLQKARGKPLSEAHALRARMLQRQRRFDEAMQEARRAVTVGPNDPRAYDVLIENLIYSGRAQEAIDLADEFLHLDPTQPAEKFFLKGMAFYTMGRLQSALSNLEQARTYNPAQTRYAAVQAAVFYELDQLEESRQALKEYVAGLYRRTTLNWTMFYWPFQQRQSAERMANALVKAGLPGSPKAYYFVAEQDRLVDNEIRVLVSDRTMIGVNRGETGSEGELEVSRDHNAQITGQGFLTYFREGTTRIVNRLLCDPWWTFGDYCVAIYRNRNGAPDTQDEYVFFTLANTYTFSVFNSMN